MSEAVTKESATPATPYDETFYRDRAEGSLRSARRLLPRVLAAVRARSALDVGCGVGTWLRALSDLGVEEIMGVDGDYVRAAELKIPVEKFRAMNLAAPEPLGRRFDLVLSMEVAEHLSPEHADGFVNYLTEHGDVVLFSAACPNQQGTDHRNEQWPAYWANKFASRGYRALDGLRLWCLNDAQISWWYAQNAILYATDAAIQRFPRLQAMPLFAPDDLPALVHPKLLEHWIESFVKRIPEARLGELLPALPTAIRRSLEFRLKR